MCNGVIGNMANNFAYANNLSKLFSVLFLIDCPKSGDDEGEGCNEVYCPSSCQPNGKCLTLSNGPTCICPQGYEYNEQSQQCEVIEENEIFS